MTHGTVLHDNRTGKLIECYHDNQFQLHLKKVEKVRRAAKNLREVGENFIRGTYEKIRKGEKFPDAMFSYVLQEIHEAGELPFCKLFPY